MNGSAGPFEIADLVARAELVKRNREIILRAAKAPAVAGSGRRRAFSPALYVEIRLRTPAAAVQDRDEPAPLD